MENFLQRYENYSPKVQEYMKYLVENLVDKYGDLNTEYILGLDMLAMNVDLMMQANEEMKKQGFEREDKYGNARKSGAVQQFQQSQGAILKLISQFGFSPSSASRIHDNKVERNTKEYLEDLING